MAINDHINAQTKRGCKIIVCDPAKKQIEGQTQAGEVISINAYVYSPFFRWPKVGEQVMVREENGSWYLEGIWEAPGERAGDEALHEEPGDAVISASSGRVLVREADLNKENGKLRVLGAEAPKIGTEYKDFAIGDKKVQEEDEGEGRAISTDHDTYCIIEVGI